MRKLAGILAVAICLGTGGAGWADVYVLKSGGVIEGKTVRVYPKKVPGQGAPKNVYVVKKEDGKEEEISEKDIAYWVKARPSWEVRAENKAWYEKEVAAVKDDWKSHESFAKKVRAKRYLEAESEKHFKKAYELRKPEIKDDIESHTTVAKLLEGDWELYEEAKQEWRWVYNKRRETCDSPEKLATLAKWCMDEGLYDEAGDAYDEALKLNPKHDGATRGKRFLANAPKMNSQFYRALFNRLQQMVGLLESKRKPDGSYGSDITEAAVHGHHAMTALVGLSLLAKWDFNAIKNPSALDACPATVKAILPWICLNDKRTMDEKESKDVWGPIWRLEFLAQCYRHYAIGETMKKAIVTRVEQTLNELRGLVRADGGWAYYEFVQEGITFVTACAIVAMVDAKEAGLPFDDTMISKACDSVASARQSAGLYGYHHRGAEDEVGCAGRSPLCEYALIRAGKGDPAALATGVENFFKHRHLLEAIKDKEGTHIGKGQTAPYYYLFGHYWTSRALHLLPKEKQGEYYKKMRDILSRNMKPNGELTDTPLTKDNEVYGTAFGALWAYQIAIEEWKETKREEPPPKDEEKR
jgi:hypothetical protein